MLTRDAGWHHDGVEVARSLEEALEERGPKSLSYTNDDVFIIGGGEVYRQAMPLADKIYLTHVDGDWTGDTFFPSIDPELWKEVRREAHEGFEFLLYERI